MRAWTGFVAALSAFASSPVGPQTAFAAEAATNCGIPSDVHDGWAITPTEEQGLNAALLCAMDEGIVRGKLANVDSIVVVRHGVLVYERYYIFCPHQFEFDATTRHQGYSMTKSVVSLLVGIAMDRGLIKDIDAPVISYFPEGTELLAPDQDRITLRHLLTMSAGLGSKRAPGVSFSYKDRETELVGSILNKVTGKTIEMLAQEDIFTPLGISDFEWHKDASSGLPTAARGLELRPRDWAKIGQLVLARGAWNGKQIVPASWIAQSTAEQIKAEGPRSAEQISADGPRSYGYQWWLGQSRDKDRTVQWVAAMGFNSQKTIIIPAFDMVVVFNASLVSKNMVTPELDLLDRYILPAATN